ncbi:MAG: signal peptidase I [Thermomicrobiales bacterium]
MTMDSERPVSTGRDIPHFGSPPDGDHYDVATADDPRIAPGAETRPDSRSGVGRAVREIVETIILAAVIFVAVRAVVLNFKVDGSSMLPNLVNTEMLLVNRNVYFNFDRNAVLNLLPGDDREGEDITYVFHPPERGDIIVFDPPTARPSEQPYIKRVIGLAGDVIQIRNGSVFVNDVELDEPYIAAGITGCTTERFCGPVTVPEGSIFVLGDNRNNSTDSRVFGPVPIDDIIGKAWLTYWPMKHFDLVPHYDYPELSG